MIDSGSKNGLLFVSKGLVNQVAAIYTNKSSFEMAIMRSE